MVLQGCRLKRSNSVQKGFQLVLTIVKIIAPLLRFHDAFQKRFGSLGILSTQSALMAKYSS